jgi:DNA polymerase-3 subunit beta
MRFYIQKENFLKLLEDVSFALSSRSTLPILEYIKIDAKENSVFLLSTNLSFSLKVNGNAEVEEEGVLCVKGKELKEVVSRLKNEKILVEKKDERTLFISTSKGDYNFFIMSADEFPGIEEIKEVSSFKIKGEKLLKGVEKIAFCVAKNDARQFLNNILVDIKDNRITLVGSDSHKLGLYEIELEEELGEGKYLVDPRSFDVIKNHKNEEITLKFSESLMGLSFENGEEIVRLVDDEYPDYRAVIPSETENKLKITRHDILDVLRRLSVFTSSPNYPILFELDKGEVVVKAESGEIGEAVERLPCFYEGENMDIGFNCTYLIDILRHIEEDNVEFLFVGKENATLIKGENSDKNLYLLMPIRI